MTNTQDIKNTLIEKYNAEEFVIDKSGVKTVEILNASFVVDKPFIIREPNQDYITREIEWYESKSLNVNDIPGETPKIWKDVATPEGIINSNYGFLIYSPKNGNQFKNVVKELKANPNSRRAVMIYTRPKMHKEYNKNGMSDFICTNTVQYFLRDVPNSKKPTKKLVVIVNMRSNDVVFGFNNDVAWQIHVAKQVAKKLKVKEDNIEINWNVGSLHVYEKHFNLLENIVTEPIPHIVSATSG